MHKKNKPKNIVKVKAYTIDYFGDIVSEGFFRAISHLETILKGSFYQNGGPMKKSLQKENMSTLK